MGFIIAVPTLLTRNQDFVGGADLSNYDELNRQKPWKIRSTGDFWDITWLPRTLHKAYAAQKAHENSHFLISSGRTLSNSSCSRCEVYGARRCTPRYYRAFTITDAIIDTLRWEMATQLYRKK